jgi:hypothetical protein
MACPPPLLESLSKTLKANKNKLTVEIKVETKSKKGPRIVITDVEMLDWLRATGYNIESVLKSGHTDNLKLKGNDPIWQFNVSKFPPSTEPAAPKPFRRTPRQVKPKPPPTSIPTKPTPPPPASTKPKRSKK